MTDDILVALARDEDQLRSLRDLGLSSMLTVPLRAAGVTLGAISLMLSHSSRRFSPEDADLAQALGDLAGLHMRNAQLYTERSHIARTLQRSLLPRALPPIPGMEVAARYEAAGNENEVGGDFYDVFQADEGVWAALIGDVSGKGAEAAAVTSLARHTLRTSTLQASGPALNLATLNRALMAEVETTRFCTVLYARVRPAAHGALLTISNGGHLAPRVLRPGRGVETLDIRGTLVGAVADARFQEIGLTLEPGATLVMFTDGVTEVRGKPPDFGERELDRALAGLAGQSAEDVAEAILVHALAMHDGDPRDDMALLVLRMRPTADDGGRP
jgi:serine phosphatase RsbU (regulator of sigma subunit)